MKSQARFWSAAAAPTRAIRSESSPGIGELDQRRGRGGAAELGPALRDPAERRLDLPRLRRQVAGVDAGRGAEDDRRDADEDRSEERHRAELPGAAPPGLAHRLAAR